VEKSPGREILIVEDNADARETLKMLLEMMGHKVHIASDGESGVAVAERVKPEIMLVDIGLPRMDGYEVARHIRAANGWPSRPLLIAVTGYGQESDRQRAIAAGFDLHMAKPIEPNQLMEVIDGKVAADL
jgi:CheY-like chemotaxis protein